MTKMIVRIDGMTLIRQNRATQRKTCITATLIATNLTLDGKRLFLFLVCLLHYYKQYYII
jgi:hypothetical protein